MARQRLKTGRWITAARALAIFAPLCLAAGPFAPPARAQSLEGVGVVLIHGKRGGQAPLRPLAAALKAEGAVVLLPRMSWARSGYRSYQETLAEIADAVAQAHTLGARKVYLAGHSLGANVSIGYSASGGAVEGVVAMAPGHRPGAIRRHTGDSLARARAMIADGRGHEAATFKDYNQGALIVTHTSAHAYVSFFDPDGPAGRASRAQGVRAPVLWVIGRDDRGAMRDPAPMSTGVRIEVDANHRDTPIAGAEAVVDWLKRRQPRPACLQCRAPP